MKGAWWDRERTAIGESHNSNEASMYVIKRVININLANNNNNQKTWRGTSFNHDDI